MLPPLFVIAPLVSASAFGERSEARAVTTWRLTCWLGVESMISKSISKSRSQPNNKTSLTKSRPVGAEVASPSVSWRCTTTCSISCTSAPSEDKRLKSSVVIPGRSWPVTLIKMVWGSVTPLTVHRRGSLSYNPCIDNFETPFRPS